MFKSLVAVAATLGLAASAQALTITSSPLDVNPAAGESVVFDFDSAPAAGYSYVGGTVYSASVPNVAAAPAGDTTKFLAVLGGETATLTFAKAVKSFSVYIGSVDAYNTLEFKGPGGYDSGKLFGTALPGAATGDQTSGASNRRYFFTFADGESAKTVTLSGNQNSFEIDNVAVAGVPEPTSWALFIVGFGLVGAARRRKSATTVVAA